MLHLSSAVTDAALLMQRHSIMLLHNALLILTTRTITKGRRAPLQAQMQHLPPLPPMLAPLMPQSVSNASESAGVAAAFLSSCLATVDASQFDSGATSTMTGDRSALANKFNQIDELLV